MIVFCTNCGETWEIDYDPVACECEDSEWILDNGNGYKLAAAVKEFEGKLNK